jgi:outer membrane protein OmpA-like peptidoglycan-associated protein
VEAPQPQIIEKIVEKIVEKPVYIEKTTTTEPEVRTNAMVEKIRREIFFGNAVTSIQKGDEVKIQEVADFLKRNPNAKVIVEGYASKDGGRTSAALNSRLAGKRAQTVVNILKTKHGIPASRITMVNKGDTEQPFPTNDQNRVCILVAE